MGELSRLLSERGLPMPGVGLNVNGSLSLYLTSVGTISPHHAFLSVTEFRSVLAAIGSGTPHEFRRGLLDAVHESLRSRSLLADRVSNLTGWSRVFDTLDVPALAPPPPPTDSATTRIALRSNSAVIYRLRLAHQAKSLFMAVDVKPHLSSASHDELKRVAEAAGASLSAGAQGPTLSISGVQLSRASDRLNSFVEATAPLFGEAH